MKRDSARQAIPVSVPAHPGSSSMASSRRLSQLQRRDTAPELAVRRLLHAAGYRYRVAFPVPGQRRRTIDIAFTGDRLAIFIDGCFWHGCPSHGTSPRSNSEWWQQKLSANRARDRSTEALLADLGWSFLRFWEHEDPALVVDAIADRLARRPYDAGATASPGRQRDETLSLSVRAKNATG